MSNVIICDRCGVDIPVPEKKLRRFMIFFKLRDYQGYFEGNEGQYHFCYDCFRKYKKWMRGED